MSIQKTLDKREHNYGSFVNCGYVAQRIKDALTCGDSWRGLSGYERESLHMIATKMSRIASGGGSKDCWHDIAGYATLIENELTKINEGNNPGAKSAMRD